MAEPAAIPPPRLAADGLLLRPYAPADAPALFAAARASAESVGRWLPWCRADYGLADAETWIAHCAATWESGDQYGFAVFDAGGNRFLGGAGLNGFSREHNFANLGYWTRFDARGHGIAARAGRLVAGFGFRTLGLMRIEILAAIDNLASRRTAEHIGARFEGIARRRLLLRGQALDAAVYALIAPSDDGRQP